MRKGETQGLRRSKPRPCRSPPTPMAAISCRPRPRRDRPQAFAASPIRANFGCAPGLLGRLQEAVLDHRLRGGLGGRDRGAARDHEPTLAELQFPAMELYAMPAATSHCSTTRRQSRRVDRRRSAAGLRRPRKLRLRDRQRRQQAQGLLDYTKVADASWSWGNLGYIATARRAPSRRRTPPTS